MFDAILIASYGGPEDMSEVRPFLDAVLSGKRVPQARRDAVLARYELFGGVSPLPMEIRTFCALLEEELRRLELPVKVFSGTLYSSPTMPEATAALEREGVKSVLVLPASAFGSDPGCRRYRAAFVDALDACSESFSAGLEYSFVPPFFDQPDYLRAVADSLLEALAWSSLEDGFAPTETEPGKTLVLFTAHSIPLAAAEPARHKAQLERAIELLLTKIADSPAGGVEKGARRETLAPFVGDPLIRANLDPDRPRAALDPDVDFALAFQSRSGAPASPWLEPDACDFLRCYKEKNPDLKSVVVLPLGFLFENMETVYDLDTELRGVCEELQVRYRRARCSGTAPRFARFVAGLAGLEPDAFPKGKQLCPVCDFSCRNAGSR